MTKKKKKTHTYNPKIEITKRIWFAVKRKKEEPDTISNGIEIANGVELKS